MGQIKKTDFIAKRVTRSYTQTINAEPAMAHSLICPVREAEWLDYWDCSLIYSQSGFAEKGCVFVSRDSSGEETIWLMTGRDDDDFVTEFVRVTPDSRVATLSTAVEAAKGGRSFVRIVYTFTALNEKGNASIDSFTEESFVADMKFWEATVNHYLETGKSLPNPNSENWLGARPALDDGN
ncbi:MAG: hypothetical protein GY854_35415 [Deltaproteobacteria bacterium]|nr:hypothetical protein [Deltaproteobacteria bacterium]